MSNNIPVITQEEFEPENRENPMLTMALPDLDPPLVPRFPKKKMHQQGLWGKEAIPAPGPRKITVQEHMRGPNRVRTHERNWTAKPKGNKKKHKINKPKKKTAKQPKHTAFPKEVQDDKESVKLASYLELKDKLNYFEGLKNK
jgi:hypothetical protein